MGPASKDADLPNCAKFLGLSDEISRHPSGAASSGSHLIG
jgi:hypothetical protein